MPPLGLKKVSLSPYIKALLEHNHMVFIEGWCLDTSGL